MAGLCPYSSSFRDWTDPCVRGSWSALAPAILVAAYLIALIPLPRALTRPFAVFHTFLPLKEAEAYDADESFTNPVVNPDRSVTESSHNGHDEPDEPLNGVKLGRLDDEPRPPLWVAITLSSISVVQIVVWTAIGTYKFATLSLDKGWGWDSASWSSIWDAIRPLIISTTWIFAAVKPMVKPTITAPFDLFVLYVAHFLGAVLTIGSIIFDHQIYGDPLPPTLFVAAYILNLVAIVFLILIVLSRPVGVPSRKIDKSEIGESISPEEYTSLWGWLSFGWVQPLVARGTYVTLNEDDVWRLSPTIASRNVFRKFSAVKRKSLFFQIWASNAFDITFDFLLTIVSVTFNYAGPFFLKQILDAIQDPTPERRAKAYIYAVLAFCCTVMKAEADVQHLWLGRRAATRIKGELMAAVYEKALKRKDFSGVVDDKGNEKKGESSGGKGKGDKSKTDESKAGSNIGKIVNLMSSDSNRISGIVSGLYFIYGAPLEILIASTFLYQLLGWSAFAGFTVLLLGWPLNSFLSRRSIRIHRTLLACRDVRMNVLNELLLAVKFVKFFAWEDRWIKRVSDARQVELRWMAKARINSILFSTLWSTAPILVSILSFLCYVWQGNELTVGTAFTAIALFNMIRSPLNVIPSWIVQILQTRVAMQRIETFLHEEEVDEQVSSIKRAQTADPPAYDEFGLRNATLKWNAVAKQEEEARTNSKKSAASERSIELPEERDTEPGSGSQSPSHVETDRMFELKDVTVVFPDGELTVVTGPTASGKTALLLAVLGEMTKVSGEILMSKEPHRVDEYGLAHTISYAAQSPWLQHQSIKENILFGSPYEEDRYNEVVESCALLPDLSIFEDGDETEIGARGISLSGGQKARVALARAVYAKTKYVLLDDPLSAVDSHTAQFLFERLFLGSLLRHRTVVLVTHHVELVLPGAYYLVRMLDGRIDCQGTIKELRSQGVLEDIAHTSELEAKEVEGDHTETIEETQEPTKASEGVLSGNQATRSSKQKKSRKLVKEEERESGSVKWKIYKTYLVASSYWTWIILLTVICCRELLGVTEKYWIMKWGEAYDAPNQAGLFSHYFATSVTLEESRLLDATVSNHYNALVPIFVQNAFPGNLPPAREHPFFYVGIYACIGFTTVVVSVSGTATQYTGAYRASKRLFKQLLETVVRATMRWHDVTPTGRMLNRFSKDIETVDLSLASSLQSVNASLATFFSSIIVVVFVFPAFLGPAIFIGFIYYRLAIGYLNTGRDLRRMESTTRSPIFSGFGEMLEGIVTVRAFSAEDRFLNGLFTKIDTTLRMWYNFWMTNRWLLLRFDCLGALGVLMTTIFALSGYVSAGMAGLCITSAMSFTVNMYWACRNWTQLELDLNSVERVVEYLELPQEPPEIIENSRPPAHWPSSTGPNSDSLVVVEHLEVRYAPDLPAVLKDVSFSVKARERIGLLGRTGSGKSTLAMSILRFVDPTKGRIMIDGIDITTIGIHDLRSRLTFIPQDAALFSGSLRDNLDPFGDYSDLECLDALYRVQLLTERSYISQRSSREQSRAPSVHAIEREDTNTTAVDPTEATKEPSSTPSIISNSPTATAADLSGTKTPTQITLDTEISAGGLNFSTGQRQLIAMARALLRQSSIIILDEATSSIDFETDAKIQKTIREEFSSSLLLTIAHRLRTVIDYDRLIVLDKGQIVEFDTPYNLINKEGGIFRGMCMKSGTFSELEGAARAKAESLQ